MRKTIAIIFLISGLFYGYGITEAGERFEVLVKATGPQSDYNLHVTGEFPGQTGWSQGPWVAVANYLTLVHTKFKSLHIYLKRLELPPEGEETTLADFISKMIKPALKNVQSNSDNPDYKPHFKVVYEKSGEVGVKKLAGYQAEYQYNNTKNEMLAVKYYVVRQGRYIHMATYTGLLEEFDAFKDTFEAFAASLDFII